jgi:putative transposase
MGAPYSVDLRERVAAAIAGGMSCRSAAAHFSIGESTAIRWARRVRETGSPAPMPVGGGRTFVLAEEAEWLKARFELNARHRGQLLWRVERDRPARPQL